METSERKITKEDKALFIAQMQETPGWQVFSKWLEEQLEIHRAQLEEKLDEQTLGRIKMLKDINQQLKEYVTIRELGE